ncbi:MAG: glucokinase, partial [Candidatus Electrothrix sp. AX5]|nr:glucokinase [Candidatus Electrothrix sp. AX5]
MSSLLLAGDIGATKTVLALYDTNNSLLTEKTFRNKEFSGLSDIITSFLAGQEEQPSRACFGA